MSGYRKLLCVLIFLPVAIAGFSQAVYISGSPAVILDHDFYQSSDEMTLFGGGALFVGVMITENISLELGGAFGLAFYPENSFGQDYMGNAFIGVGYYIFLNEYSSIVFSLSIHGGLISTRMNVKYGPGFNVMYVTALEKTNTLQFHAGIRGAVDFIAMDGGSIASDFIFSYTIAPFVGIVWRFMDFHPGVTEII